MFKKLWQWLKNLVGIFSPRPEPAKLEAIASSLDNSPEKSPSPLLGDRDYEFLFDQVLEGVAHGWQTPRIKQFFEQTQDRITLEQWVNWLIQFGKQKIDSPQPDRELARRLNLLAVQTQNIPSIAEIGAASLAISQQLLQQEAKGEVWEYDGPDLAVDAVTPEPQTVVFTLEELHEKLKEDANFRQAIAQQVGVNSDDPMVILQAVAYQISQQQENS
ncbi:MULTISPECIES: hypothetical protein [Spirulina sp. CCY15215]|uniref:hypothetical protein n=1 Tax=Spirulina sp. CCY15215 TaxID=2767591 RepID=UPI001951803E|nr:hypothetical protein [Spirulina major]